MIDLGGIWRKGIHIRELIAFHDSDEESGGRAIIVKEDRSLCV